MEGPLRRSTRDSVIRSSQQTTSNPSSSKPPAKKKKKVATVSAPRRRTLQSSQTPISDHTDLDEESEDQIDSRHQTETLTKKNQNGTGDHQSEEEPPPDSDEASVHSDQNDREFTVKSSKPKRQTLGAKRGRPRKNQPGVAKVPKQPRRTAKPKGANQHQNRDEQDDAGSDAPDPQAKADYAISEDNDLYNSIRRGPSAIEPTLEDWMEIYRGTGNDEEAKGEAIALLVTCILRCCGCNSSIDKHEALDLDAAAETLDDIQEQFKQVPNPSYPLIARAGKAVPKNFRRNLISLFQHLLKLAHSTSVLYDEQFSSSLQSYLVSMSSSSLRSFRHTATVISLFGFVSGFCDILHEVRKEFTSLSRKVEAEAERDRNKGNTNLTRKVQLQEWEKRKADVQAQKRALEGYINDFFDGVFVHRYRDADPNIRVDCVQALGQWINKVPDHFLGGNYLRYFGWVLTDSNKDARYEALKALNSLYAKEDNIGPMQHFTYRFKARLVEMATGEPVMSSRCLAISILSVVDKHGLLESDHRGQLVRLIYHEDFRVRKAIGGFFSSILHEMYDARRIKMNAHASSLNTTGKAALKRQQVEDAEKRLGFKCLAALLIKCGRQNILNSDDDDNEDDDDGSHSEGSNNEGVVRKRVRGESMEDPPPNHDIGIGYVSNYPEKGRVALAVEYLWDEVDVVRDWEAMADYLLLDHSSSSDRSNRLSSLVESRHQRGSVSGSHNAPMEREEEQEEEEEEVIAVEEACKLTESEESLLIEVFVAALRKAGSILTLEELAGQKKRRKKLNQRKKNMLTDDESEESDDGLRAEVDDVLEQNTNKIEITRVMIKILPKLFSKYSTDPTRLLEILRIPKLMCLHLYLDLRMVPAYEELWDVLIKQYLKQQVPPTIEVNSFAIEHLWNAGKALAHVNQQKIEQLDEQLLGSLVDTISTKTDLEISIFEDHEIESLDLILLKIVYLIRHRDLASVLEGKDSIEDEPISSLKPLDLINGIAHRGRLGYREEGKMVETAIEIQQLNFMWACASLYRMVSAGDDVHEVEGPASDVKEKTSRVLQLRDGVIALLTEYAVDPDCHATENVKQAAFIHLLNTYLLCCGSLMQKELAMDCDEQTQFRCAGFVAAQVERFKNESRGALTGSDSESESGDDQDDREHSKRKKSTTEKRTSKESSGTGTDRIPRPSVKELRGQEQFDLLITTFTKAICCGLIHFQHANVILPHYTRFGQVFDLSVEVLVGSLKGCLGNEATQKETLAKTVSEVLRESFDLFLNEEIGSEEQFLRLSKLLLSSIVIRGPRLSVKPVLDSPAYVALHTNCIEWLVKKSIDLETDVTAPTKSPVMFKGLIHLLAGMDGRAALKIKSSMDLSIQNHGLDIPDTSKCWDPYRTYLKRLISIMAKDPSIKRAAKLALKKQSGAAGSGEEDREQAIEPRVNDDDELVNEHESDEEVRLERIRPARPARQPDHDDADAGDRVPAPRRTANGPKPSTIAKGKGRAIRQSVSPASSDHRRNQSSRMSEFGSVHIPSSSPSRSLSRGNHRTRSLVSVVIPLNSDTPKRKRSDDPSLQSSSAIGGEKEARDVPRNAKRRRKSVSVTEESQHQEQLTSTGGGAVDDVEMSGDVESSDGESEISLGEMRRQARRARK